MQNNKTLEALKLTLLALLDLVRQLPVDERLAYYNLDLAERAELTAKEVISNTVPYDERTERQRVIDELINELDPAQETIINWLKRKRSA